MKTNMNTLAKAMIACMLFVCTTQFSMAQMATDNLNPPVVMINFEVESLDYGTIKQHSDGLRSFTFTNTGDAPLVIANVKYSCGCTVPSYSKNPIAPNATGTIMVKYDTKRLGSFNKTITVTSNATEVTTRLKVKGNVVVTK